MGIESPAADVLHHDEVVAIHRPGLVNRDDVRVIEGRGGLRFLHEAPTAVLVRQTVRGQYFYRDFAIQTRIARAIDSPMRPAPSIDARVSIEQWRRHYNEVRPHSGLGYLTPAEYKRKHLAGARDGGRSPAMPARADQAEQCALNS
jgi:transposase InsO family protein